MAFSNTVTDVIPLGNGLIMEIGTWKGTAVTTGTITAATGSASYSAGDVEMASVLISDFASDGDTAVSKAYDQNPNQVKITFTSGDTGDYRLIGKAK